MIGVCLIPLARAGDPPDLLDDNRGDGVLAGIVTTAFNAAIATAGFQANPLTFAYPPFVIRGRVLEHPEIHNLYLDDDWDANNPDAPTRAQLDAFTQELVSGPYLVEASQYGVGSATFTGSHQRSLSCIPVQPLFGNAEFVQILAWVTCEVGFNPLPVPGFFPPLSGVPQTSNNTLYVVYLPRSTTIRDGDCNSLNGVHFFGAAPQVDRFLIFPVPYSQTFAYAVIPTQCATGSTPQAIRDQITEAASHEIIEAATDPLVGTGWINNSVVTAADGDFFFDKVIRELSNISTDLKVGEVADICENASTPQSGPPAYQLPTPPIYLPVSDAALDNLILVSPYWSNAQAGCAPFLPTSDLAFGSPRIPGPNGTFVTSSTMLTITATNGGATAPVASVSYRYFLQGTAPPAFITQAPPVAFTLSGSDGRYDVELFATGDTGIVEAPPNLATAVLDNTPPVVGIVAPAAIQYAHSDTLTLSYSPSDGTGSGVAFTVASLDGLPTVGGHGLTNGQVISLLTEMSLGPHSFKVESEDHLGNHGSTSVSFTIVVTPESIKQDVTVFRTAGLIKNSGLANSLLAKLSAAAAARTRGQCATAGNNYGAFINHLEAQSGKGVDASAGTIMIGDAQYLIAHCP